MDRDLRTDRLAFDDLGWRGLWAYVTAAPPFTAVHYLRSEGWTIGERIAAEQLYATHELLWRYAAIHFEGGMDRPWPQRIPYPGSEPDVHVQTKTWETVTVEEMIPPEVRALLQG